MSSISLWKNWFRHADPEEGILLILQKVPIFQGLSIKEMRQIREMMHIRHFGDQEPVFLEGEPGTGMYVVVKGTVRVVLHYKETDEVELVRLEAGDFFGELSLLDESPRSATCVVEGATELGGFFRSDLMDLVDRQPTTGTKIILRIAEVIAERLRQTNADLRLTKEELKTARQSLKSLSENG